MEKDNDPVIGGDEESQPAMPRVKRDEGYYQGGYYIWRDGDTEFVTGPDGLTEEYPI